MADKISELEKKVILERKNTLADTFDPIVAWIEEMKRTFWEIFKDGKWENKITLSMEKFENKWFRK